MVVPAVVVMLLVVLQAGVLGADIVAAQGLAREVARTAAIGTAEDLDALQRAAAGEREAQLEVQPSDPAEGTLVTARVRLRSRAFGNVGVDVWIPARATMRVEGP